MRFSVLLKPKAAKDLGRLLLDDRLRVVERLRWLEDNLRGDVKRLSNHTPEYRMRSGDYRVLFEVELQEIIVYRILHRRDAYR